MKVRSKVLAVLTAAGVLGAAQVQPQRPPEPPKDFNGQKPPLPPKMSRDMRGNPPEPPMSRDKRPPMPPRSGDRRPPEMPRR